MKPDRVFSASHVIVVAGLWIAFGILDAIIAGAGLTGLTDPERMLRASMTGLAAIAGPMTGAVARDFQGCCLWFSLTVMPFAAIGPVIALAIQFLVPARSTVLIVVRLMAWTIGWLVWFGSGILSLGHALS